MAKLAEMGAATGGGGRPAAAGGAPAPSPGHRRLARRCLSSLTAIMWSSASRQGSFCAATLTHPESHPRVSPSPWPQARAPIIPGRS